MNAIDALYEFAVRAKLAMDQRDTADAFTLLQWLEAGSLQKLIDPVYTAVTAVVFSDPVPITFSKVTDIKNAKVDVNQKTTVDDILRHLTKENYPLNGPELVMRGVMKDGSFVILDRGLRLIALRHEYPDINEMLVTYAAHTVPVTVDGVEVTLKDLIWTNSVGKVKATFGMPTGIMMLGDKVLLDTQGLYYAWIASDKAKITLTTAPS
ncbi:Hypothetical protein POVN_LOCUS385 [uncultured virus]|nr:Hypothetical protein POVN_LOCUS385 [uncultured virus]